MEKKEEKVKVEVEIEDDKQSPTMSDATFVLNTGQSGEATLISTPFSGMLKAVLITADKAVEVEITLAGSDIVLYKNVNFFGSAYLPLRIEPVMNDALKIKNGYTMWALNEALQISVKGPFNTTVNFTVRMC